MASVEETYTQMIRGVEALGEAHLDQVAIKLGHLQLNGAVRTAAEGVEGVLVEADCSIRAASGYARQGQERLAQGTATLQTALAGAARPEADTALSAAQLASLHTETVVAHVDDMRRRRLSMAGHVAALLDDLTAYEGAREAAMTEIETARGLRSDAVSHVDFYAQTLTGQR